MQCTIHPEASAVGQCVGCAESYCGNCLVEIQGQQYCSSCKTMAIEGQPGAVEAAMVPCPEANDALKYAIVGLFCFGIILEPLAIAKALKAKKMMALNPNLSGSGKATAALVVAIVGLVLWVLGIAARVANAGF